ncbi:DUF2310 family Zn-ribbon-containing protein [Chromatiaceae bacterium AAb-1]|nr:DUF2310 family Zn-ribbon-containing protein [Chromatiaceae bacterium AAb-1]
MYLAELRFRIVADTSYPDAEKAIRQYIEALIFNGQILGREFPTALSADTFCSRVVIPEENALHPSLHNARALQAQQELIAAGLAYPSLEVLGMDLMSQHTSPSQVSEYYILFTTFADTCSPVRCSEYLSPVPLYRLNTGSHQDHEALIRWQLQYQALDEIQMQQQRVLHKTAENSLQQLHSTLNRQGRKLARQLEQRTGKPFFYALYSGSSPDCAAEPHKSCPGCGNNWRLTTPLHQLFDFKCDHCRLLSNIAWDCQNPS